MILVQVAGDKKTHKIRAYWQRIAFDPGVSYTDYTIEFEFRVVGSAEDTYVFQKTSPTDVTIASGIASVSLEKDDTVDLEVGSYEWRLRAINTSDAQDVKTLNRGKFTILKDVQNSGSCSNTRIIDGGVSDNPNLLTVIDGGGA